LTQKIFHHDLKMLAEMDATTAAIMQATQPQTSKTVDRPNNRTGQNRAAINGKKPLPAYDYEVY